MAKTTKYTFESVGCARVFTPPGDPRGGGRRGREGAMGPGGGALAGTMIQGWIQRPRGHSELGDVQGAQGGLLRTQSPLGVQSPGGSQNTGGGGQKSPRTRAAPHSRWSKVCQLITKFAKRLYLNDYAVECLFLIYLCFSFFCCDCCFSPV